MTPKFTRHCFCFLLLLFALFISNSSQAQSYSENFDDVSTLAGKGWVIQNNSNPLGVRSWYQGIPTNASPDPGPFNAYNGANNAYIAANFSNTTGSTGIISSWLITPNRTLRNGDVFTFYTRKPTIGPGMTDYPDRLEVRLSTNGASTNAGSTATGVGDFNTLLLSVNPTLVAGGYPQTWTQYTITISGLPAPTSGRIAFRYFVTNAGPSGSASDYIGVDQVNYSQYVCPGFTLTPGGALTAGKAGVAYSYTLSQTGALGAPNFAITAGALPPGLTIAANGTISGTPTATGTFNFTATANDASGCSGSQPYSITVVCGNNPVTFNPKLVCNNSEVELSALPAGGVFYGTGVTGNNFDPSVGTQTVNYAYTDPYGCAFEGSALMTVVDPGITTVTPQTQSVCSGAPITTITGNNTESGSFTWTRDNTSSVTGIAASGNGSITGSLTNTTNAAVTVTFTLTSNVSGCTLPVTSTVQVNPATTISCPGNIVLNNAANTCGATATYTATANGIPGPAITYSFSGATIGSGNGTGSGSTFNVGITTVTLTATNTCGSQSCSFTVTVKDTQKPTITCPAPVTVSCTGNIPAPDINSVTASVNCSGVVKAFVSDVIGNQTCANRYTISRTYSATDNAGNIETCTQIITVDDQTAPVITCPANINTTNAGSCSGATVNFTVNATDNCSGTVNISSLPASGSVFPVGTTTVTSTATDACGNQSTCTFTVTVTDVLTPVITTAPVDISVCPSQDAVFHVTATHVVSYQWQKLQESNWVNIDDANNSSFTVPGVTGSVTGERYRVMLTGACTTVYSDPVKINIKTAPSPTITTGTEICLEARNIQLQATPAGGIFSGTGVTGSNWNLEIPAIGTQTITYTYTDAQGCSATTSKQIKLGFCDSSRSISILQGYPNPTRGKLSVRALITQEAAYTLRATDLNGRQIWSRSITLHRGWNLVDANLAGQKAGMYIITLARSSGDKGHIKVLKID